MVFFNMLEEPVVIPPPGIRIIATVCGIKTASATVFAWTINVRAMIATVPAIVLVDAIASWT